MPCPRIGSFPPHHFKACPTKDAVCQKCKKCGHYQRVCRYVQVVLVSQQMDYELKEDSDTDYAFMGALGGGDSNCQWSINPQLEGKSISFPIDTGAEVTVIPETVYKKIGSPHVQPSDKHLKGLTYWQ